MNLGKWGLLLLILLLTDLKLIQCRKNIGRGGSVSRGNMGGNTGGANVGGGGSAFINQGRTGKGGFKKAGSGIASNSRGGINLHSGGGVSSSRGGGGGSVRSGGRGISAARGSSGYHGSSIGGGISTFSKGSGIGSAMRSNTFKTAIAGTGAGYLTYQAGKHTIRSAGGPMMWGGRSYYWAPVYYQRQSSYEMCSIPLVNSTDKTFNDVFFSNGTRPKQIVWSCRAYTESCCGYECCPNSGTVQTWEILLIVSIVFLLFLCCGCFILYHFFRKAFDCISPSKKDNNTGVKLDEYPTNH